MVSSLRDKVVWLTGASSGIGEAVARELATSACKLVLSARREQELQSLCDALEPIAKAQGGDVLALPVDITDKQQISQTVDRITNDFGPVDVLIANAGTHIPTEVEAFDSEEYDKLMRVNFSGSIYCIESVLPSMIERKSGHVVGVSSLAAYRGLPKAAAYGASKAALSHFLESLRFDLIAHKVQVTIVNPGFVKTPLTDKNDFEMPFLIDASDAAKIIRRGIEKKKLEIHFPWKFSWLMKLFRILPYPLYHTIIANKVVPK